MGCPTGIVEKFAASKALNMDHWSAAAQFRAALDASPEVAGLASDQLTLFMVLTILRLTKQQVEPIK